MDRKQLITGVAVAVAVVGLWFGFLQILHRVEPQLFIPPVEQPDQQAQAAPNPASPPVGVPATAPGVASVPATGPATGPAVTLAPPAPAAVKVLGAAGDQPPVVLGAAAPAAGGKGHFAMEVTLTPKGAGIASVMLDGYNDADNRKDPYVFQQPYEDHDDSQPLASRLIVVNGTWVDLSQVDWKELPGDDPTRARFVLPLVDAAGKPLATLTKTFSLKPASSDPTTSQGYELGVDTEVENQSGAPLSVQAAFNGPTTPPKELARGADRSIVIGYSVGPAVMAVTQHLIEEFKNTVPTMELTKDKAGQSAMWAGTSSAYFEAILQPLPAPASSPKVQYAINAQSLDPDSPDRLVVITFQTAAVTLQAGQTLALPTNLFLGPKKQDLLFSAYYAAYPRHYDQSLVIHGSYCGFLTFNWLVWTLVAILRFFHFIFRDWGLAIICLVILVRVVLHPITKKSQVSMLRMGKMGPEIERLKKKYGDDKEALNKAMMDVYKDQGPATLLGCLPMFLQMPIWIALWGALQSTFEFRQAPFLWGFTWIKNLARPDAIMHWSPFNLPLIGAISSLNLLPILMAVVFYFQQKYTPKPPAATPEQAQQQKMMQWMSLLFPVFLYTEPSGLNLYILTSTTMGIFENRIIRNHIKKREEAEKAGRVFVDVKPTRANKQKDKDKKDDTKKSKLGRWLSDLQQRADQLRTETERNKKRRET